MSRRIDIELTSARPDGTWTWRAAGAREPKGVLEGAILPDAAKAGDVLKVDVEFEVEGITVLGLAGLAKSRKAPSLLELIPAERNFEPVTQTLAKRERGDRPRGDGDRDRPRRDGERRGPRPDGAGRGPRPEGAGRGPRPDGERRGPRPDGDRPNRPAGRRFEPVPEVPQRPKPKRLKPGKAHRTAILAGLGEAERAIAEKALSGGIPAVRQAVNDQNAALRAEGKDEIPAAGLLKMAEELLPQLRVAEWLDRADAAKADIQDLDLRDLRSVVVAGDDPAVSRDETTRALAAELKAALVLKQEQASSEWLEDIQLALGVGRVIRALKLSAEPPKAGMRFPAEVAGPLAAAATAALSPDSVADRWSAVLEAVAFSPVRAQVTPAAPPAQVSDELTSTVTRLAVLVPQIAALFGITPPAGAQAPKPLRPTRAKPERKPGQPGQPAGRPAPAPGGRGPGAPRSERPPRPAPTVEAPAEASTPDAPAGAPVTAAADESPAVETAATTAVDAPAEAPEAAAPQAPAQETPAQEAPAQEAPAQAGAAEVSVDAPTEEPPTEAPVAEVAVAEVAVAEVAVADAVTDAPAEEAAAPVSTDAPADSDS